MFQIDNIRGKNNSFFYDVYLDSGKNILIESLAEGLVKRSYFTIDEFGHIKNKDMNRGLIMISNINHSNYKAIIDTVLNEMINLKERVKIKKIKRLSKYYLETLKKNFNKILANGSLVFGLRYGKELFLRDKQLFFYKLFDYVLLENIDSEKAVMAWALYKILRNSEFSDEIFFVGMSYILQKKSQFNLFDESLNLNINSVSKPDIFDLTSKIDALEIYTYGKLLNEFTYEKESVYCEMLKLELDKFLYNKRL